jgi:ABC-2 type transport system permease protein
VAASAVARRTFGDARGRTISFAVLFLVASITQATAYREGYPTRTDRLDFARSVGANDAARILYGVPHDLLSVGGYVTWRVGGTLAIFAAVWGMLAAVRAMRADEESGRAELVLAGVTGRRQVFMAQLAAIGSGAVVLWLVLFGSLVAGRLPAGGSAYLALAIVSTAPVFAGVGAVTSQLAPTRRMATGLATGVLLVAFALRTVAAISSGGVEWLRWATPLGWVEELRPFAGPRPLVLVAPAAASAVLVVTAAVLGRGRDVGRGLLPSRERAPARLGLLGSPTAQGLRLERGSLIAWVAGVGAFALMMGVISDAATPDVISDQVRRQLEKLGTGSVVTPSGWLGFSFTFFVLAVSLFCCTQIAALRGEEGDGRLETLLALPVGRGGWLAGRLVLAALAAAGVALAAGVLAWAGAASQGAGVSLSSMLGAGANCLPAALLFLALGALAFAIAPRASPGIAYGLVGAAFVWQLFGSLLEAPEWLLSLSPFHDVGLIPGESFKAVGAGAMLGLAAVSAFVASRVFERRDLIAS